MKKIILIAALVLGVSIAANAQPRTIGARLAYGLEVSYQHTVKNADFVEANLGLFGFGALNATATYNFMIAQPQWTSKGEWGFYAGPGASVGFGFANYFSVAVAGQVGLEYTFWFPLQLSIDLRPQIGAIFGQGHAGFYTGGLLGFAPTLGIRYRF